LAVPLNVAGNELEVDVPNVKALAWLVGATQLGMEIQLTLANHPARLVVPSERKRMVMAPEASVEIIVPGLVFP
jgi:hypothetical protein